MYLPYCESTEIDLYCHTIEELLEEPEEELVQVTTPCYSDPTPVSMAPTWIVYDDY